MTDDLVNFAQTTVQTAPSPADSGTDFYLITGPPSPTPPYDLTVWRSGQPQYNTSEIIRVLAQSGNHITDCLREQYGTTPMDIEAGWQAGQNLTAAMLAQLEGPGLVGSGTPTVTPDFQGQQYTDTGGSGQWLATTADSSGWQQIGGLFADGPGVVFGFNGNTGDVATVSADATAFIQALSAANGNGIIFGAGSGLGVVRFFTCEGDPNGSVTAISLNDFCFDNMTPAIWTAGAADDAHWVQLGGSPYVGTSPQTPVALEPVVWVMISNALLGAVIPAFTYDNGSSGVGATVTETTATDGALLIDGNTPALGDRVFFGSDTDSDPDGVAAGIYTVTALGDGATVPWVMTRATDNDTESSLFQYWSAGVTGLGNEFDPGSFVAVSNTFPQPVGVGSIAFNINSNGSGTVGGNGSIVAGSGVAFGSPATAIGGTAFGDGAIASGNESVAIGSGALASGNGSTALGQGTTASGTNSFCFGQDSEASGQYSTVLGIGSLADGDGGIAEGVQARAWAPWLWAISGGAFSVQGGSQYDFWVPYNQTTDATPTLLGTAATGITLGAPTVFALTPPDFIRTMLCEFRIVARRTDVPGEASVWECNNFVIDGDGSGAYRLVGTPSVTVVQQDAAVISDGWDAVPSLTSDNTGIQVTVTGAAGQTIQWTCTIKLYEVAG